VSAALEQTLASPKSMGAATVGFTSVLHTWNQQLLGDPLPRLPPSGGQEKPRTGELPGRRHAGDRARNPTATSARAPRMVVCLLRQGHGIVGPHPRAGPYGPSSIPSPAQAMRRVNPNKFGVIRLRAIGLRNVEPRAHASGFGQIRLKNPFHAAWQTTKQSRSRGHSRHTGIKSVATGHMPRRTSSLRQTQKA